MATPRTEQRGGPAGISSQMLLHLSLTRNLEKWHHCPYFSTEKQSHRDTMFLAHLVSLKATSKILSPQPDSTVFELYVTMNLIPQLILKCFWLHNKLSFALSLSWLPSQQAIHTFISHPCQWHMQILSQNALCRKYTKWCFKKAGILGWCYAKHSHCCLRRWPTVVFIVNTEEICQN